MTTRFEIIRYEVPRDQIPHLLYAAHGRPHLMGLRYHLEEIMKHPMYRGKEVLPVRAETEEERDFVDYILAIREYMRRDPRLEFQGYPTNKEARERDMEFFRERILDAR